VGASAFKDGRLNHENNMKHGKKFRAAQEKVERNKIYTIEEAIKLVLENKIAKFDESVEVHARLSIDTKKGEEQVRGTVVLPHGTGKMKKVAVITTTKAAEAKEAGADVIGGEEIIEQIKAGKLEAVDVIVATPEMMPKLAQVAKILGPRGLMPSPKTETVTDKIKETVEMLKKGKSSFKNDNTGNIHLVIGKTSFDAIKLQENLTAFMDAMTKAKPAAVKGRFVTTVSLCSTMGPGIKVVQ